MYKCLHLRIAMVFTRQSACPVEITPVDVTCVLASDSFVGAHEPLIAERKSHRPFVNKQLQHVPVVPVAVVAHGPAFSAPRPGGGGRGRGGEAGASPRPLGRAVRIAVVQDERDVDGKGRDATRPEETSVDRRSILEEVVGVERLLVVEESERREDWNDCLSVTEVERARLVTEEKF